MDDQYDSSLDGAASALSMGGDILKGYGAYEQGQDNAGIALYNAKIATRNAAIARAQGEEMARRSLINGRKVIGQAAANYGGAGVEGVSVDLVLRNSAAQNELNALTIQHNAQIKAGAYNDEAQLDQMRAANASSAADLGVASAFLSGMKDMAGMAVMAG